MTEFHCRVPGCEFTSHARRGIQSHARKHKRQFREVTGKRHDDYAGVREQLAGRVGPNGDLLTRPDQNPDREPSGNQTTLADVTERTGTATEN